MKRLINKAGWVVAGALAIAVVASIAGVVFGGPLDPPGPPGSTQRNLIFQPANCAAFPITISTSGSYVLGQNITIPAACAADGIDITTDSVTLDLGGFKLLSTSPASLTGVRVTAAFGNISIRNGSVQGWGANAVDGGGGSGDQFADLQGGSNPAGFGLLATGTNQTITRVIVNGSGLGGISASNAIISDCAVTGSGAGGPGINVSGSSVVTNCSVSGNGGNGMTVSGSGALIENNTVRSNTGSGILVSGIGNTIRGNTIFGTVGATVPTG